MSENVLQPFMECLDQYVTDVRVNVPVKDIITKLDRPSGAFDTYVGICEDYRRKAEDIRNGSDPPYVTHEEALAFSHVRNAAIRELAYMEVCAEVTSIVQDELRDELMKTVGAHSSSTNINKARIFVLEWKETDIHRSMLAIATDTLEKYDRIVIHGIQRYDALNDALKTVVKKHHSGRMRAH